MQLYRRISYNYALEIELCTVWGALQLRQREGVMHPHRLWRVTVLF